MREGVNYKHKELIELANGLGINENSTKVAISRMVKKGVIKQQNGGYILG
jgi:DNA-binding transcriptional regulator PaaX